MKLHSCSFADAGVAEQRIPAVNETCKVVVDSSASTERQFDGGLRRCGQRRRKMYTGLCLLGLLWCILNDGMAFHLAAGGSFPIGQAFGLRWKTVGAMYAF